MCHIPRTLAALIVCLLFAGQPVTWGDEQPVTTGQHEQSETVAAPTETSDTVPHLVVIRISERAFDSIVGKAVDVTKTVDDVILGTTVHGRSHTRGKVAVDINPDHDDASFVFTFVGETHAKTVGHNGPAILYSRSSTDFTCTKHVLFDLENGFHAGPTSIDSKTNSVTDDIQSDRRGIRGRLIRRVAWRRVKENHDEANAVTADHTRRDIVTGFDETISERLAELNERVALSELVGELLQGVTETEYSVSSTDKYIQLAVRRKGMPETPITLPEDSVSETALQVWVHSSLIEPNVFGAVQSYSRMRQWVRPVLSALNQRRLSPGVRLTFIRASFGWQLLERPFFSRLAAQRWSRERNGSRVDWTTTEQWLVVGIRDAEVVGRLARNGRDRQAVSAAR